jgi:predicted nucleic acid-binding protein
MVFVDTSGWFAWFVSDDPDHRAVADWIDAVSEPILTTDFCVDETLTLLVAGKRSELAIRAGRFFFQEHHIAVRSVTPDEVYRAWILFQTRAFAGWSR